MKSIEEKAKRYDEAIKKAKDMLSYKEVRCEDMEYLFPELKESDDGRIRKAIICGMYALKDQHKTCFASIPIDNVIAWLEKQEQNRKEGSALETAKEVKVDNQNCVKPADKVEPKFREGDIVQYITDSTDRRKIEEVDELCNMYHTDKSPIMFEVEDEWKIIVLAEDVEHKRQVNFPQFTFDDVLALQCAMENVKKVREDKDLYNKLLLLHNKVHDAYTIKKDKLL